MSAPGRTATPVSALRRITRNRPQPAAGERCEMCAEPVAPEHSHVVNLESRALMCSCRACYLLFTEEDARQRYRAVPERYLRFDGVPLDARAWDELQIPVGLAFLFRNSVQGRTVAFYPGPAGATESELPLEAWDSIVASAPALAVLRPDVEALLIRRPGTGDGSCHLVPVDACYELVGRLRTLWRGFDGGREAHAAMDAFFDQVRDRSRTVPAEGVS
ncbi:DUF5947 family protein [Streptomyces sp. NBC_01020]|uniref:DUF5947 family protein n=1 Tax=unclassified Streptomyces TaxID=2593676 RepID=UPI00225AED1D|nr:MULTISPECIES: DUF5947 family protein [unclassified Streptomyces]MCX4723127.1 DUF5947 family protein [Streptomyces sp. NBC_01306]WSV07237.1 DUF5947 family protein [Streptomyces sp. NBC_01020]